MPRSERAAGGGGGGRRGRAREARSPVSDADPFSVPFPSITPSPPSLARPTHGTRAHEDNMGPHRAHGSAHCHARDPCVSSARARTHALVRVLNNAYGDRVWLSCIPKDTHARDRFVWTRKTTLLGDRRESSLGPFLLITGKEEKERYMYTRESRAELDRAPHRHKAQ